MVMSVKDEEEEEEEKKHVTILHGRIHQREQVQNDDRLGIVSINFRVRRDETDKEEGNH